MSDGGRGRAPLGVELWKSSQKWSVLRSAVRSIAWLDHVREAWLANRCLETEQVICGQAKNGDRQDPFHPRLVHK